MSPILRLYETSFVIYNTNINRFLNKNSNGYTGKLSAAKRFNKKEQAIRERDRRNVKMKHPPLVVMDVSETINLTEVND